MKSSKKFGLAFKAIALLLVAGFGYLTTPTLAFDFAQGWLFGVVVLAILVAPTSGDSSSKRITQSVTVVVLGFAAFLVVSILTTWSAFHASAYRELLGPVKTMGKFEAGLPPIDLAAAPLVDESMARRTAEKRLSDIAGMGSQFQLGKMTKQRIGQKLVWVGFLEYRSIFVQWNQGKTPGYVRVSATDADDVQLVTKVDGKDLALTYLEGAYFGHDVERHVWLHGYMTRGVSHFVAHIDEAGRPFYLATLYRHAVGFAGADATGALTIDAQSGEIKEYALTNAPAWVDRIYTESMVESQSEDWGRYVKGWFNPSDEGRVKPSGEIVFVDGKDRSYFYTGVTNYSSKETSVNGFLLVDALTKEARLYQISGVSEETAQKSALGVIPEKKYAATYPLPFSIDKVPTYVMTLKDDTGIARAYAMVSIENYRTLAVGDTLTSTLRAYQARISGEASKFDANTGDVHVVNLTSKVSRIASDIHGGSTIYYITLQDDAKHFFTGSIDLSEKLPLTRVDDQVKVSFVEGDTNVANLKSFDNLSITQGNAAK